MLGVWLAVAAISVILVAGYISIPVAAVAVPYPHDLGQVSFAVAGDVIPHQAVREAAAADGPDEAGWQALFGDVSDVFRGADFGFVNMETPVAPAHSKGSKPFMFDAPVALPEALKASGIKIVSFANNHVMDQGWAGFAETREHLREVGLLFAGTGDTAQTGWQPVITEANGIKVGWLGMTRWLNGNRNPDKDEVPHVNFFPYPGEAGGAQGMDEARRAGGGEGGARTVRSAGGVDSLGDRVCDGAEAGGCGDGAQDAGCRGVGDCGASSACAATGGDLQDCRWTEHGDLLLAGELPLEPVANVCGWADAGQGRRSAGLNDWVVLGGAEGLWTGRSARGTGARWDLPVWGENNRNEVASGRAKTPVIHPVLIDREMPRLQARLDALNKIAEANKADASCAGIDGG